MVVHTTLIFVDVHVKTVHYNLKSFVFSWHDLSFTLGTCKCLQPPGDAVVIKVLKEDEEKGDLY